MVGTFISEEIKSPRGFEKSKLLYLSDRESLELRIMKSFHFLRNHDVKTNVAKYKKYVSKLCLNIRMLVS